MAGMSSASYVTAVLHFLQAFNRDDLDACERFLDPQIEWHSAVTYTGRPEARAMLQSLRERCSRPQARPDDFREAAGHVLMIVCFYESAPDAQPREQRQSWIANRAENGLIRRALAPPPPADAARALEALAAAAPKV